MDLIGYAILHGGKKISGKAYFELWNSSFVEIPVGEYVCVIRINGTWEKHDINYEIKCPYWL